MTNSTNEYEGNFELRVTENSLSSYNLFIVKNIVASLPTNCSNPKILDFGSGIGTLADLLGNQIQASISCFEIDEIQAAECNLRGFSSFTNWEQLNEQKFDLIYTSNVLEHIENDYQTVETLKLHLNKGGILFIYVPAHKFLWTELDDKVGHHRRYSKQRLKSVVEAVNLEIIKIRYVDFLGVFALFLVKLVGFKSDGGLGGNFSLKIYDKLIWPLSKFFDMFAKHVIGKNLMLIARNK